MPSPQSKFQIAESLGAMLSRSRQEKRLTVEKISARLGIPEKWVMMAEADRWQEIPDDAYSRIYFRSYCKAMGLDTRTMREIYRQTRQRCQASGKGPEPIRRHPKTAVPTWQMIVTTSLIRKVMLGLVGLGLVGYFWWAIAGIVTPPKIILERPNDGLVTDERSVIIEGRTEREVRLTINGKYVTPDSNGYFSDTLELADGLNTIKVSGSKKHSEETVIIRQIIYEPRF